MPEAILKFNLPEDQDDFELATNASKYYSVLWELDQYLRSKVKYPAEDVHEEYTNAMEKARQEIWNLLESYHLDLDR
jgi:hypothetical protein